MALAPLPINEDKALHQESVPSPYPVIGASSPAVVEATAAVLPAEEQRMQELERMLQEAQGRAEMMEREAYDKAYAAGEKAGMALGAKRAEQSLEQLDNLLKQAEDKVAHLAETCNDTILDIAQTVIEHALGNLGEQRYTMLLEAVQRASLQMPDISSLTLLVNPEDMAIFNRLLEDTSNGSWRLKVLPDIPQGCCRLVSEKQDIQLDPEAAIKATMEQLAIRLQGEGGVAESEELL